MGGCTGSGADRLVVGPFCVIKAMAEPDHVLSGKRTEQLCVWCQSTFATPACAMRRGARRG